MSSNNDANIQQNANEGTPTHLLTISPEVQRIIKDLQDTIDKRTKRIDELERKCNRTDFTVTTNRNRMNELEERTRQTCLTFSNVEVESSPMSKILSILNYVMQIKVTEKDIAACHPLNKARVAPIIVKFIYHEHRDFA